MQVKQLADAARVLSRAGGLPWGCFLRRDGLVDVWEESGMMVELVKQVHLQKDGGARDLLATHSLK